MSLGQNIYRLRTEHKMSQEDFASAMEVSRQSVSKWENDSAVPELEKLIKMSQLFGVSLDELVGNAPPQPKSAPVPAPIIATGDLVSVVLLFLGMILPFLTTFLSTELNNNMIIYILGWCFFPLLSILGASLCSTRSKLMQRVFLVYTVVISILEYFLAGPYTWLPIVFNILIIEDWAKQIKKAS